MGERSADGLVRAIKAGCNTRTKPSALHFAKDSGRPLLGSLQAGAKGSARLLPGMEREAALDQGNVKIWQEAAISEWFVSAGVLQGKNLELVAAPKPDTAN